VKFKLYENLPDLVRGSSTALAHDVHGVAEEGLGGARDDAVLRACVSEGRVLITLDLDFSDIRAYPPEEHAGLWVLRPAKQTFKTIEALVLAGLRLVSTEPIQGRLWIIDERRVRIRAGHHDQAG
jgi:predicted nuclease of predicted toxin-antitoxin system